MNKITRLAFLTSASALVLLAQGPPPGGFGGGRGFGPGGPGRGGHPEKVVTGAPYTGTLTEQRQQTLSDGNQISTTTTTKIYRDSEGRVRRESTRTMRNGQTATFVTIFDPVAGFEARLNPEKLTAEKHTLPPQNANAAARPKPPAGEDAPQVTTAELGSKTIEGLAATGKQVTMTIPAGEMGNAEAIQTVRVVWTSTALQVPVQTSSTNPQFGTTTTQLTGITQAEPDATLFQIPSSYKVSTRSAHPGPPPAAE